MMFSQRNRFSSLLIMLLLCVTSAAGCMGDDAAVPHAASAAPEDASSTDKADAFANGSEPAPTRSRDTQETNLPTVSRTRPPVIAFADTRPAVAHDRFRTGSVGGLADIPGGPVPVVNMTAEQLDGSAISTLPENTFVHITDSRVVGFFYGSDGSRPPDGVAPPHPHGTGVADAAVGIQVGGCPGCLMVWVTGIEGFAWAYHQEWIDAFTLSEVPVADPGVSGLEKVLGKLQDTGRPVFVANMNGLLDPARDLRGSHVADAIFVAQTRKDGSYQGGANNLFPHLAARGEFELAMPDGGTEERWGTSFAAPHLAGLYGRFLMAGWEEGWLRRVVDNGSVRQVIGAGSPLHQFFSDGHIDGDDVVDLFSLVATLKYGVTDHSIDDTATRHGFEKNPGYHVGHGVVTEAEIERLIELARPSSAASPDPEVEDLGPLWHATDAKRLQLRELFARHQESACDLPQRPAQYRCDLEYLMTHDDWYR